LSIEGFGRKFTIRAAVTKTEKKKKKGGEAKKGHILEIATASTLKKRNVQKGKSGGLEMRGKAPHKRGGKKASQGWTIRRRLIF